MSDRIAEENLATTIGQRVLDDADKLRLFMPDCLARFPIKVDGYRYEIHIYPKGPADAA